MRHFKAELSTEEVILRSVRNHIEDASNFKSYPTNRRIKITFDREVPTPLPELRTLAKRVHEDIRHSLNSLGKVTKDILVLARGKTWEVQVEMEQPRMARLIRRTAIRHLVRTGHLINDSVLNPRPASIEDQLMNLLALLRAVQWNHLTCHWTATGDDSYEDHLLFERLYESVQKEVDSLAEKLVAKYGVNAVNAMEQAQKVITHLGAWVDESNLIKRALRAETEIQIVIQQVLEDSEDHIDQTLSVGVENFLQGVADAHETSIYLLQQRIRNRTARSQRTSSSHIVQGKNLTDPIEVHGQHFWISGSAWGQTSTQPKIMWLVNEPPPPDVKWYGVNKSRYLLWFKDGTDSRENDASREALNTLKAKLLSRSQKGEVYALPKEYAAFDDSFEDTFREARQNVDDAIKEENEQAKIEREQQEQNRVEELKRWLGTLKPGTPVKVFQPSVLGFGGRQIPGWWIGAKPNGIQLIWAKFPGNQKFQLYKVRPGTLMKGTGPDLDLVIVKRLLGRV